MKWGRLFNDGWEFSEQSADTAGMDTGWQDFTFRAVELPHDWLIYNTKDLYRNSTGWYRKRFCRTGKGDSRVILRFDGIYMDSSIYLNGTKCGEWKYGYSAFEVGITELLTDGMNELVVKVVHRAPNSRWYSGAGIYRNVWIREVGRISFAPDDIYITPVCLNGLWNVEVDTRLCVPGGSGGDRIELNHAVFVSAYNSGYRTFSQISDYEETICGELPAAVSHQLTEYKEAEENASCSTGGKEIGKDAREVIDSQRLTLTDGQLWSPESPCLYILETKLYINGTLCQTQHSRFGLRTIEFRPESGFCLNGIPTKLNGVCEHHDLGCLGTAYNQTAMRRKFRILKEMGVNAVRTAHNMPAAELMDLADEMGILILSESFDMWERQKTEYDYARFFKGWYARDMASWITRDRNHPSVIMWSIGNEIYDTHADAHGQEITAALMAEVRRHDPKGHAPVTIGSNYMPWENAQKCADLVKLAGYNYSEKYYEQHHAEHPDWIIYGSETASTVQSRGIYHFPYNKSVLADEDEQCSALGNSTTSWGAVSPESCIVAERDCSFSCGQFLWTGFDYIGEPTPYHTKNSYFGQVDTAGFPKDSYYLYRSMWREHTAASQLHIFPYWDFNTGQTVDVRVAGRVPQVELFVNGRSQGIRHLDHDNGSILTADYQVVYEPGEVKAVACDEAGNIMGQAVIHSFGEPRKLCLEADRHTMTADGRDLIYLTISVQDEDGYTVENAVNRVTVQVKGCGRLAGLDNGDSTDYDEYKGKSRRLFSGRLLAVIQSGAEAGPVEVTVTSTGLEPASVKLTAIETVPPEGVSVCDTPWDVCETQELPVRKIGLMGNGGSTLTADHPQVHITASLCPGNASDRELLWSVVDDGGIPSCLAELSVDEQGMGCTVTALGDGAFRVRCMSRSGSEHVRVISQLDFTAEGLGQAYIDPYSFVSGGLYRYSKGKAGNGNEHGVATARDGETQVGYRGLDFGSEGSDEITIPVFALSDEPYYIQIYEGMPDEDGSSLLADVVYRKPSRWNVYQEETYRLNRKLTGITDICFVLHQKIHLKGFTFTRQSRAFDECHAASCSRVYGDSFRRQGDGIYGIGNNVTLEYGTLDFGEEGSGELLVCGHSPIPINSIHLRFRSEETQKDMKLLLEFEESTGFQTRRFRLDRIYGRQMVAFVFLPGSSFDFEWFRFIPLSGEDTK